MVRFASYLCAAYFASDLLKDPLGVEIPSANHSNLREGRAAHNQSMAVRAAAVSQK